MISEAGRVIDVLFILLIAFIILGLNTKTKTNNESVPEDTKVPPHIDVFLSVDGVKCNDQMIAPGDLTKIIEKALIEVDDLFVAARIQKRVAFELIHVYESAIPINKKTGKKPAWVQTVLEDS